MPVFTGLIFSHGLRAIVPLATGPNHGDQKKAVFFAAKTTVFHGFFTYQTRAHFTLALSTWASVPFSDAGQGTPLYFPL